jgi:hypothetical protein
VVTRGWGRLPIPAAIRDWRCVLPHGCAPARIRGLARISGLDPGHIGGRNLGHTSGRDPGHSSGRNLARTRSRDLARRRGPGRIHGWTHGWAPGRERARSPHPGPAPEPIHGGKGWRMRRPAPSPTPGSDRSRGPAHRPAQLAKPAHGRAQLPHGHVPAVARTPIPAAVCARAPHRRRAGTRARRPRSVPRVPGRRLRGPALVPAAHRTAQVSAVPPAGGQQAADLGSADWEPGGPVPGDPAGSASPAMRVTRTVRSIRKGHPVRASRRGLGTTISPARPSHTGQPGHVPFCRAAMGRLVAGSAARRARGHCRSALVGQPPAGTARAGAARRSSVCRESGCWLVRQGSPSV